MFQGKLKTKVALCGLTVLLTACTGQQLELKDEIVAKINGSPIYAADFLVNYQQLKSEQDDISQKNPRLQEQLKTRALNEVLLLGILRQEATKKEIRVAREEVEGRLANWKDGYPPGGFEEMLRKQNTTENYLKRRLEDQLLLEKMTEVLFGAESLVSDDEISRYYQENKASFVRPERVHVFQIVVPTLEEAKKIRQDILSHTVTFESAARTFSLSPDASKGGDLGFFAKNEKIAAFNHAFSLSIGQVSNPIESQFGVHLLKTVEKQPSTKLSFQDAKQEIVKQLRRDKQVKAYKEWAAKLLKDAEIYRNDKVFNSIG